MLNACKIYAVLGKKFFQVWNLKMFCIKIFVNLLKIISFLTIYSHSNVTPEAFLSLSKKKRLRDGFKKYCFILKTINSKVSTRPAAHKSGNSQIIVRFVQRILVFWKKFFWFRGAKCIFIIPSTRNFISSRRWTDLIKVVKSEIRLVCNNAVVFLTMMMIDNKLRLPIPQILMTRMDRRQNKRNSPMYLQNVNGLKN